MRHNRVKYIIISIMFTVFLCTGLSGCRAKEVIWEDGSAAGPEDGAAQSAARDGQSDKDTLVLAERMTEAGIRVYVCGQVNRPGVYTLKEGDRVVDALNMAGGMTPDADAQALNLARMLRDEEQIIVYSGEEISEMNAPADGQIPSSGAMQDGASTDSRIDLNTASVQELMSLPGIGRSRAEAIVAWRQDNGGFSAIEDIMKISGIKNAIFSQIKDKIKV